MSEVGIRKSVIGKREKATNKTNAHRFQNLRFRYTGDIIEAAEWVRELVWQNVKNVIKRLMLK